jgi:hypothetical protein
MKSFTHVRSQRIGNAHYVIMPPKLLELLNAGRFAKGIRFLVCQQSGKNIFVFGIKECSSFTFKKM